MLSMCKIAVLSILVSLLAVAIYASPLRAAEGKSPSTAQKSELWSKRCQDIKDPKNEKKVAGKYCEIFQRLAYVSADGKSQQRVAEFAIGYPPGEKKAKAVLILPLGVLVQETMSIFIDEKNENHFHVQYCLADGCYATLNLPEDVLGMIGKGKKLTIDGKAMNGQDLRIIMDLTGFATALTKVKP